MKKISLLISIIINSYAILLSQKEYAKWNFGNQAGIDFASGSASAVTGSAMTVVDCPATISDSLGNLLFYSDDLQVWNKNNQVMPNGTGLIGNISGGQMANIVRKPGSYNLYYLFTNDSYGGPSGLRYTTVDINLNGGLGDVVASEKNVLILPTASEQIVVTKDANGQDIWLIAHPANSASFNVYHITAAGINTTPVVSNIGAYRTAGGDDACGQITIDGSGSHIAMAHYDANEFELFNFDNSTGIISNLLTFSNCDKPWGVEFSPDGNKLYVDGWTTQYVDQFDLSTYSQSAISASLVNLGNVTGPGAPYFTGYMQRAVDGKIYIAVYTDTYLAVIDNPNMGGVACSLVDNGFYMGGMTSQAGLPDKVVVTRSKCILNVNLGKDTVLCTGQRMILNATTPGVAYLWQDSSSNSTYAVFTGGNYSVTITDSSGCSASDTIKVNYTSTPPVIDLGGPRSVCQDSMFLSTSTSNATFKWNDGSTDSTLTVFESGQYSVTASNGCGAANAQITVELLRDQCGLLVPTGFSPNADGKNDIFHVISYCPTSNFSIKIYNRWGELLYQSTDITVGWDGTFKDRAQPIGVYVYYIDYFNHCKGAMDKRSGNVTLIR